MTRIKKDCLVKKTTLKKAEKEHLVQNDKLGPKPIPFRDWVQFKLWDYSIPPQGLWESKGLCIVRNGKIVNYIETDNIDNYEPENGVFVDSYGISFLECQTIVKDSGGASYMLSVRPEDYYKLITDGGGHLKRYLFDSRWLDFLSKAEVIEQISRALANQELLLSLMSHSVTIIATTATVQGKTMQLCDIQILDGLQITKIIHQQFQGGSAPSDGGNLFVKIIVASDVQAYDIISRISYQGVPLTNAELQSLRNRLKSSHSS
jgi:hypothetical protein